MDKMNRSYALSIGYAIFLIILYLIMQPSTLAQAGYFLILAGAASIALYPLVPEGIRGGRWDSQKRKRQLLWGGIGGIAFGILIILLLR